MFENLPERDRLVHAVTEYDRKDAARAARAKRGYHNRYALGQYFERLDDCERDVAAGATWRQAIIAGFTGRLRDLCLKTLGQPVATETEIAASERGAWHYVPASETDHV